MAKKYLITLDDTDSTELEVMAAAHGRTPTGMITYMIRLQMGALPEVQPLKVQPLRGIHERETIAEAPKQEPPREIPVNEVPHSGASKETWTDASEEPEQEAPKSEKKTAAQFAHLLQPSAQVTPKREPRPWIPNKNLKAYTEETDPGSGIFTDGKDFAVQSGPAGRQTAHFFQFLHEAEEFKENEAF